MCGNLKDGSQEELKHIIVTNVIIISKDDIMVLGEDVLASSPLFFYSVCYKTIEKFSIKYLVIYCKFHKNLV